MKQLQESEQKSMAYAKRILELQEATQKASDAIKSCHSTNIQLSQEKKVCIFGCSEEPLGTCMS